MHNAPAVAYPVGRSALYAVVLLGLSLLGIFSTVLGWWEAPQRTIGWRQLALGGMWLSCTGFAAFSWWRSPQGTLRWDGHVWYWDDVPGGIQVGLDAQRMLWVRWTAQDERSRAVRWVCLESSRSPLQWMDLRRAVYSPGHVRSQPPSL
jgi:hypothetical protein